MEKPKIRDRKCKRLSEDVVADVFRMVALYSFRSDKARWEFIYRASGDLARKLVYATFKSPRASLAELSKCDFYTMNCVSDAAQNKGYWDRDDCWVKIS